MDQKILHGRIRVLLVFFILALAVSGLTAIPLGPEIVLLRGWFGNGTPFATSWPEMAVWIERIYDGITATSAKYPFMLYGTDWLAFGHIAIAVAFVGPLRDPARNLWVIEFGMIACALIVPWAFIFGALRDIPIFWRLIDCSFGVFGFIPLWLARKYALQLAE